MSTSPITRRAALVGGTVALAGAGLALSGCASQPDESPGTPRSPRPSRTPSAAASSSQTKGPVETPVTTLSTAHGFEAMWPNEPIDVAVEHGTIAEVVVTDDAGTPIPGTVTGSQWRPNRGALLVRSNYHVKATVADANGDLHDGGYAAITTVNPYHVVEVDFRYADGHPIGNGMPIWVRFDLPIEDAQRAAIEERCTVTTNPPQEGAWGWVDATTLYWRPRNYWLAGSTAHVEVKAAGQAGADTWVLNDAAADYIFSSQLRVLQANIDTHTMTCLQDGAVAAILPISMGKPGYETMTGTKVIMDKQNPVIMDSETYGVPHSDPEGYKITAYYAQRLTWSGEYIHAAPWADADHGNANVSHGCTGLSDADSGWLWNFTMIGDPVEFTGSTPMVQMHQTYGGWMLSWEQWQQQSALV